MYREPKEPHVLCWLSFCEACHFVRPIPVPMIMSIFPRCWWESFGARCNDTRSMRPVHWFYEGKVCHDTWNVSLGHTIIITGGNWWKTSSFWGYSFWLVASQGQWTVDLNHRRIASLLMREWCAMKCGTCSGDSEEISPILLPWYVLHHVRQLDIPQLHQRAQWWTIQWWTTQYRRWMVCWFSKYHDNDQFNILFIFCAWLFWISGVESWNKEKKENQGNYATFIKFYHDQFSCFLSFF